MRQGSRIDAIPRSQEQQGGEDHWVALSDCERDGFERHANFLIDQGYMAIDPLTLAVRIAWKLRDSPRPEGLVYEDGSPARRESD
jgi:hypothetical protein